MIDYKSRIEFKKEIQYKTNDESVEDTFLDLANYAIMTVMWLEKKKNEKVQGEIDDAFIMKPIINGENIMLPKKESDSPEARGW